MSLLFAIALPTIIAAFSGGTGALPLTQVGEKTDREVIAAQLRKQGYRCNKAVNAERDSEHPDEKGGWLLQCDDVTYHVHLVPRRKAYVEIVK